MNCHFFHIETKMSQYETLFKSLVIFAEYNFVQLLVMLRKRLLKMTVLVMLIFMSNGAYAQNWQYFNIYIPQVALLAVRGETNTNLSLGLDGPAEAGLGMTNTSDSSLWINYTFLRGGFTRPKGNVYTKISSGSLPSGMVLKVRAKSATSHGGGLKGTPTGQLTLTSSDQKIINNVRTSYTGRGVNKGHNLVYDLDISNYSLASYTAPIVLTITYTLTD